MKFILGFFIGAIVTILVLGTTICIASNIDVTDLWNNVYDSSTQSIRIQGV